MACLRHILRQRPEKIKSNYVYASLMPSKLDVLCVVEEELLSALSTLSRERERERVGFFLAFGIVPIILGLSRGRKENGVPK